MTFRDKIQIKAPPEKVWPWIQNPEKMMEWNPKLTRVQPISQGKCYVGYLYRARYRMSGKEKEFLAEIKGYDLCQKYSVEFTAPQGENIPRDFHATETYELTRNNGGTLFRQIVTMKNTGIPFFFQILMRFISFFGSAVGPNPLAKLKRLAEDTT